MIIRTCIIVRSDRNDVRFSLSLFIFGLRLAPSLLVGWLSPQTLCSCSYAIYEEDNEQILVRSAVDRLLTWWISDDRVK